MDKFALVTAASRVLLCHLLAKGGCNHGANGSSHGNKVNNYSTSAYSAPDFARMTSVNDVTPSVTEERTFVSWVKVSVCEMYVNFTSIQ